MSDIESRALRQKQKKETFEQFVSGEYVLVTLDGRSEGAEVPEHCRENARLSLKVSNYFQGAMRWDAMGITAALRFSGTYYDCRLPWHAIWLMQSASNEHKIWTEDIPPDIIAELFTAGKVSQVRDKIKQTLRLAKKEELEPDEKTDSSPKGAGQDRRKLLKRIK